MVSTAGSNEPGCRFASVLAQYDKDKDGRLSPAEFLRDKDLGEHFGWIDESDDKFIVDEEWNDARALGMGEWGAIAVRRAPRRPAPASAIRWRFQKNIPYIPAPLLYQGVYYMVKTGGIVTSLDPATGTLLKEGRARARWASTMRHRSPRTARCTSPIPKARSPFSRRAASGRCSPSTNSGGDHATPALAEAESTCARAARCTASQADSPPGFHRSESFRTTSYRPTSFCRCPA